MHLLFAPLKATRTRFVIEKATELGVGAIQPVLTRHGQTARVNVERLRAHAIEAAEQCGRLDVPPIAPPCSLADALAGWPPERRLLVCDPEAEPTVADTLSGGACTPWAILVGPEGGFAPPNGARSPIIRRPCAPASARGRCARRLPWRQHWPVGRPSRATGGEAVLRGTQACHVGQATGYAGQCRSNRGNPALVRRNRWEGT